MEPFFNLVAKDNKVKEVAAEFRNGQFDYLEKKYKKETKKQKGYGECFSLSIPPHVSVMSNDLLRSGLFSSAKRIDPTDESFMSNVPIATFKNKKMLLSGYTLDQFDYQVYEMLVKQYKVGGIELEIKLVDLLRLLGWDRGGNQVESLITSLKKLNSSRIQIDTTEYQYFGGLVDRAVFDKATGMVNLKLGEDIAKMYSSDNWTMLQVSDRSLLGKNMLARWLYNFMMTHKNPYPLTVNLLKGISGNSGIQNSDFKVKLVKACLLLNEKLGWECFIEKGLLHVKRKEIETDSGVINTESV